MLLATCGGSCAQNAVEGKKSAASIPARRIGQLEISVTKTRSWAVISDSFTGPSTYEDLAQVSLRITNVGNFPVCAKIHSSLEEYKDSELLDTDSAKSGLSRAPIVEHLAPGEKATGSYTFTIKPIITSSQPKRKYVLVLEQLGRSQGCGEQRKDKNTLVHGDTFIRFPL
jgi:hypothetical protein